MENLEIQIGAKPTQEQLDMLEKAAQNAVPDDEIPEFTKEVFAQLRHFVFIEQRLRI